MHLNIIKYKFTYDSGVISMTEKELKKLSRMELLELLVEQTERCEELERKLAETEQKLENQALNVKEVGTLAEACITVNKVFEAADAAAKQYLANVKVYDDKKKEMLAETERRCAEMEQVAQAKVAETERRCAEIEQIAEAKVATLKAEVDKLSLKWLKAVEE